MRGITPVIAVILLLMVTIAIVAVALSSLQKTYTAATRAGENQTRKVAERAANALLVESASGSLVTVRNAGTIAIKTSEVVTYLDSIIVNCGWSSAEIKPQSAASCTLQVACTDKTVRVVGPGNEDSMRC